MGAIALGLAFATAARADGTTSALKEVVVTAPKYVPTTNTSATKIAIPLVETPQAITVINRDQIDLLDMQNLSQAVRYTAGVVGENYGADERYDWLTLRGFKPVEYIDGLQAPVSSVSNVGLDLWGAESVEILKGPSGVLYGQSPPGGLVNVTMRRPQKAFSAEIQGLYGGYADRQVAGDVTGSILGDGALEGRLTALWRDRGTQTYGVVSRRLYLAPALTWTIDAETTLTFLGYYQADQVRGDGGGFLPWRGTDGPNPNGRIPAGFNAGEPGFNRFDRDQYGIGYELAHRFNDAVTLRQNLKVSSNRDDFASVYGAGLEPDLQTLDRNIFIYPERSRQVAVDTRVEIRGTTGGIGHLGLVGVDLRDLRYSNDVAFGDAPSINVFHPVYGQPIPSLAPAPGARQDQRQVGVYVQDQLKQGRWRLTLSAREDWLHLADAGVPDREESAFTWRAGLSYLFRGGLAPYLAYSTSFLPTPGSDFAGRPFVPSAGDQIEGGIKYEPRGLARSVRVYLSAAVFDLVQDHVLADDPDHPFHSVQTGQVEVKGVGLEAVARLWDQLNLNASYARADARVTRNADPTLIGKALPIVPPDKLSALVDYSWKTGLLAGFGLGGGARYLSSTFGDPQNLFPTGDVMLFDALAHYALARWRIEANASNLFDKVYVERCLSQAQCFYGLRRNVLVTLDRRF
jgi:iron complex outermembrane receptor protein